VRVEAGRLSPSKRVAAGSSPAPGSLSRGSSAGRAPKHRSAPPYPHPIPSSNHAPTYPPRRASRTERRHHHA